MVPGGVFPVITANVFGFTNRFVIGTPSIVTVNGTKLVPVIVINVPPYIGPPFGFTNVMIGISLYVYGMDIVKDVLTTSITTVHVTSILIRPDPPDNVAVIRVSVTLKDDVFVILVVFNKCVPVSVTIVPEFVGPRVG